MTKPRRVIGTISLTSVLLLSTLVISGCREAPPDPLLVGMMGEDGILIPIAAYDQAAWSTPWPEPTYGDDPPQPSLDVPLEWYLYADEVSREKVAIQQLTTVETHCGRNWGYTTDWGGQQERRPFFVRTIAGVMWSRPVDLPQLPSTCPIAGRRDPGSGHSRSADWRKERA
jgi:hypothetical protein